MRGIFIKLQRRQELTADEYRKLMEYADALRLESPDSYALFYDRYASILHREYATFLPRFNYGIDDLIDYLISHPDALESLEKAQMNLGLFPGRLHPYLEHLFASGPAGHEFQGILQFLKPHRSLLGQVPPPRSHPLVCKYEDANPYKEIGLKQHFDRLGRYSFVTRLQSYRYLSGRKARIDRIEYVAPDRLGGIFSNKEKSIYYYIYLSEADPIKAANACKLLNSIFHDHEE